jgi:hypothetical protein
LGSTTRHHLAKKQDGPGERYFAAKWFRLGVFSHISLPGAGKEYQFSKAMIEE